MTTNKYKKQLDRVRAERDALRDMLEDMYEDFTLYTTPTLSLPPTFFL